MATYMYSVLGYLATVLGVWWRFNEVNVEVIGSAGRRTHVESVTSGCWNEVETATGGRRKL